MQRSAAIAKMTAASCMDCRRDFGDDGHRYEIRTVAADVESDGRVDAIAPLDSRASRGDVSQHSFCAGARTKHSDVRRP